MKVSVHMIPVYPHVYKQIGARKVLGISFSRSTVNLIHQTHLYVVQLVGNLFMRGQGLLGVQNHHIHQVREKPLQYHGLLSMKNIL